MLLTFLGVTILLKYVASQQSPCPAILSYEPRDIEDDKWYGNIKLESEGDLTGIYINIVLDRPAQLLGNWFGEITSSDNKEFLIHDARYRVRGGRPFTVRFFVKFNRAQIIPSVSVIRFNGKTVCGASKIEEAIDKVEATGIIMRPNNTNRPTEERRTSSNLNLDPVTQPADRWTSTTNRYSFNRDPVTQIEDRWTPSSSTNNFDNRETTNQETNKLSNTDDDSDFFHGDFLEAISSSENRQSSSSSSKDSQANDECGVVTIGAVPLISRGQDTRPGQWPWHVSLYHSKGLQLQYICGGTLISKQHIVTAAHCVTRPSTETVVNKKNLLVYLGKHTLISFGSEVQDRDVSNINVHPEYNATSYFNDIALLKLSRPVEITNYVRPCCLWDEDPSLESVENKSGTVVGWGFDEEKKLSNKLMQAQMPIVPTIKCIYSNREFFLKYTFEKNFCAGFRNGTSVCNGDSGGGLVFPKRRKRGQNTVWQLRGLVSIGVALQTGQGVCDASQFIVFTDVAKYLHWIRQVID